MKNYEDLKDKTCLITGGGGVLGTAIAKGCAAAGMHIIILDKNAEMADKLSSELDKEFHVKSLGLAADVCDKKSLEQARETILGQFKQVDFLINGAGGNSPAATTKKEYAHPGNDWSETIFGLELKGFIDVFGLNFMGTVLPVLVFGRDMAERGNGGIINISSMNAFRPLTKIPAYSAAKAAVSNFTQWLAVHLGQTGVRVNAIAPGFFLTRQNKSLLLQESGELTERGKNILRNTPMGRFGNPEDLVGSILFLFSDASKFITGIVLPIDGGYSAFGGV